MILTSILSALCLEIFVLDTSLAEWIDMPQFSDEKKVYRIPSSKQDHFYKFTQKDALDQFPYEYHSIIPKDLTTELTVINRNDSYISDEFTHLDESQINTNLNEDETFTTTTESYDEITEKENTSEDNSNEPLVSNDTDILKYLPVDILKNVHRTLTSQPTSNEGKILFLKTFEKTLITEIESRLTQAITGNRQKRGTDHYDHYGYDHHEHATGFPSIEGALMAISFLTFAVYLVRLVMLLFRNMNNSGMNTNGATLLVGRKKRSINVLDETTAKILNGIENFSSNFK